MTDILIFGGSGGLGSGLTKELIMKTDKEIKRLSSQDCDIRSSEQVRDMITKYRPQVVINMAVYNVDNLISNTNPASVENQIDVNIIGAVNIINAFTSSHMIDSFKKSGKIIMMSSYLSEHPVKGAGIYSGCKAFIDNLVKTTALENAKYGITCNSIQLGYFDGGLTYKVPEKFMTQVKEKIPLKRLGTIEELYKTVSFIIENDYITGSNLLVDGGISLV